jgi:hypothetical protein
VRGDIEKVRSGLAECDKKGIMVRNEVDIVCNTHIFDKMWAVTQSKVQDRRSTRKGGFPRRIRAVENAEIEFVGGVVQ